MRWVVCARLGGGSAGGGGGAAPAEARGGAGLRRHQPEVGHLIRPNMAHIRQSRPCSVLGVHLRILETF